MSDGPVSGNRRWSPAVTAAIVALLVVTAGCSGLPGGGTATVAPADGADGADGSGGTDGADGSDGADGADEGMDGADAGPETTASGETSGSTPTGAEQGDGATTVGDGASAFGDFEFSEGDRYVYSAALTNTTSRLEVVWDVTGVSDEELTVETGPVWNGTFRPTQTLTGTPAEIFGGISGDSENVGSLVFLSLHIGTEIAAGHSLEVGNTWTVTPDDLTGGTGMTPESDEAEVEVTGTDSYAGVECTNIQVTAEGSPPTTYCVNPDYPFALAYDTEGVEGSDVVYEGTSVGGSGGSTATDR